VGEGGCDRTQGIKESGRVAGAMFRAQTNTRISLSL
jgi:hypothetical protein